ncbi:MAG: hypothetical protein OEO21_10940, partial [Candidatus Krumholzibacteria bacterium]|nr:hypothetical protein [Candidatus Krumholzibacteria bacterium]
MMRTRFSPAFALILALGALGPAHAQSLDLAVNGYGIGLGNSKRITGIRLNIIPDEKVEAVNGLNVTLWKPNGSPEAVINGVSVGLIGFDAYKMTGLQATLIGMRADRLRGISVAGIGMEGGDVDGVMVAGLGAGAT